MIFLELGVGQAEAVKELFGAFDVTVHKDIEGVERMLEARRGGVRG